MQSPVKTDAEVLAARSATIPETFTVEEAAQWIQKNSKEKFTHEQEIPLDDEERMHHEHLSATASTHLNVLDRLKKDFDKVLKEGTYDGLDLDQNPKYKDISFRIPPTKGTKALEANVKYHSDILEKNATTEYTDIYILPWPEKELMIAVDIEGKEWPQYTKPMNDDQKKKYNTLYKEEEEEADSTESKDQAFL